MDEKPSTWMKKTEQPIIQQLQTKFKPMTTITTNLINE
jgi:hypothetical protein